MTHDSFCVIGITSCMYMYIYIRVVNLCKHQYSLGCEYLILMLDSLSSSLSLSLFLSLSIPHKHTHTRQRTENSCPSCTPSVSVKSKGQRWQQKIQTRSLLLLLCFSEAHWHAEQPLLWRLWGRRGPALLWQVPKLIPFQLLVRVM